MDGFSTSWANVLVLTNSITCPNTTGGVMKLTIECCAAALERVLTEAQKLHSW